jgi:predicted SAM-dependent methyltransferase
MTECSNVKSIRLDLGSGAHPREGFTPVDRVKVTPETVVADLVNGTSWPFDNSSVDELASSHFIEHIPADEVSVWIADGVGNVCKGFKDRLLWFFDEAFRVIKPGGLFHLTWPALKSTDAFRDPTHRRFLPLEFLHYLSREGRAAMGLEHYGATCNWVCENAEVHGAALELQTDGGRSWDVQRAYSVVLRAEK